MSLFQRLIKHRDRGPSSGGVPVADFGGRVWMVLRDRIGEGFQTRRLISWSRPPASTARRSSRRRDADCEGRRHHEYHFKAAA